MPRSCTGRRLLHSTSLSNETGYDVWLKAEMFQRTGSYKVRGPSNKLPQLSREEQQAGVICSSAGNHAQGVAYAAARLGIPAVVLMASNATPAKIAATKSYGAEVILHGTIWDEANDEAMRLRDERGLTFIHPFDDLQLIAGQGTVGLEILEDAPDAGTVVVPIGGGGLISGIAAAIKGRRPEVRIVGVESTGAPAMTLSVERGELITLEENHCAIDGLKVMRVGEKTFSIVSELVDKPGHDRRRANLRRGALDDVSLQAGRRGRSGGAGRRAPGGAGRGGAGLEGGVRAQRRQHRPRAPARQDVELAGC